MATRRPEILAALFGVALAISIIIVASAPQHPSNGINTTIGSVLWMHGETPTSSGTQRWYNFTLTVNGSVPIADLVFHITNPTGGVIIPPNASLVVMKSALPVAEYNFTGNQWTWGGSGAIVNGNWLELQLTNQDLSGGKLVAIAVGQFRSTCSVYFP
jgi:hypothetical protein